MNHHEGASPISSGTGNATSQPITSSRLRPSRSASPPAARFVNALAAPNATTNARIAEVELSPKSCLPTRGSTLRSRPTMPPTSAFNATSSANCRALARRPKLTSPVKRPRPAVRVAGAMQLGPADVADQERVAAEDKPGLLRPTATVGDRVGVMGGSVPRCRDRGHERVPELDHLAVGQCDVLELDSGGGR